MARSRDLVRIVEGASLVAKAAAESSAAIKSLRNGDIGSFISSTMKTVVNTATDIAGLTRGTVQQFTEKEKKDKKKESIVYFTAAVESSPKKQPQNGEIHNHGEFEQKVSLNSEGSRFEAAAEVTREIGTDSSESNLGFEKSVEGTAEDFKGLRNEGGVSVDVANDVETKAKVEAPVVKKRRLRERRVPATPFGRALGFAGLGAGLAWGTLQESAKRFVFGEGDLQGGQSALSPFLSDQNAERLALALCRMRGAALKLGQMLSIQDESLIPAPILSALEIVRQGADVMPRNQLNHVLTAELGTDWQSKLRSFDYEPIAAASIGQVHKAVTKDGLEIALKIQYPGVADSIDSDIDNVKRLLDYTNLIPKGLYLDQAMKVAKAELARECDYSLEASNQKRFRELLFGTEGFYVPLVIDEISSRRILSTELVRGIPIEQVAQLNQDTRNHVGRMLLELTLKELFVFHFMQTDPNWSNFLYDERTNTINLIDFGAAREYPKQFVDNYLRMVIACANRDKENVLRMSCKLGFLTGMESEFMLDAHTQAAFVVGLPFSRTGGFDFKSTTMASDVSRLGATMLNHRLTPPPDEAYSLHRKLSGAFLACIKLGAVVPCREMLMDVYNNYKFSDVEEDEHDNAHVALA